MKIKYYRAKFFYWPEGKRILRIGYSPFEIMVKKCLIYLLCFCIVNIIVFFFFMLIYSNFCLIVKENQTIKILDDETGSVSTELVEINAKDEAMQLSSSAQFGIDRRGVYPGNSISKLAYIIQRYASIVMLTVLVGMIFNAMFTPEQKIQISDLFYNPLDHHFEFQVWNRGPGDINHTTIKFEIRRRLKNQNESIALRSTFPVEIDSKEPFFNAGAVRFVKSSNRTQNNSQISANDPPGLVRYGENDGALNPIIATSVHKNDEIVISLSGISSSNGDHISESRFFSPKKIKCGKLQRMRPYAKYTDDSNDLGPIEYRLFGQGEGIGKNCKDEECGIDIRNCPLLMADYLHNDEKNTYVSICRPEAYA